MPSLMPQAAIVEACSRRADDAAVPMPRTLAAQLAGAVAIALNIAALAAADLVPLATAHGGLRRLVAVLSGDALPIPAGGAFQGVQAATSTVNRIIRAERDG
jgi:hypothetical protein